jgi:hypothetical protein
MQSSQLGILSEKLVCAIRRKELGIVQSLVTPENIEAVDQFGYTALAHAISAGDIPTMDC